MLEETDENKCREEKVFERDKECTRWKIELNGMNLEQMNEFVYLGNMFLRDRHIDAKIMRRANAGYTWNMCKKWESVNEC